MMYGFYILPVSFVSDLELNADVVPPVSWLIWTQSFVASGSFDMRWLRCPNPWPVAGLNFAYLNLTFFCCKISHILVICQSFVLVESFPGPLLVLPGHVPPLKRPRPSRPTWCGDFNRNTALTKAVLLLFRNFSFCLHTYTIYIYIILYGTVLYYICLLQLLSFFQQWIQL